MCLCSHSLVYNSFLDMCVLLTYLSGLSCPPDCLILILLLLFFFFFRQERPSVGTRPKCILFLPPSPRWRVCLVLRYPFLAWGVSRCSSSRTKDHAIAESDRSDRNQYRNQSESCVLRDYSGRELVTIPN